jgi:lactocepin
VGTSGKVTFAVDLTPPEIIVTGVEEGGVYDSPVTPVIEIIEPHPGFETITLNGQPFVPGTPVSADGFYLLEVIAEDVVGNRSELTLQFELLQLVTEWSFTETAMLAGTGLV